MDEGKTLVVVGTKRYWFQQLSVKVPDPKEEAPE